MNLKRIAAALLVGGSGALYFYWAHATHEVDNTPFVEADLEVGSRLCLPESFPLDDVTSRYVIAITNAQCFACAVADPFETLLFARSAELGIPVIRVLPMRSDNDERAGELRSMGFAVVRADLGKIGVTRVPAYVAVHPAGEVLAMAVGAVTADRAQVTIEQLTIGNSDPMYDVIDRDEMTSISRRGDDYQLLALGDQESTLFPGATSLAIPGSDLSIRARYELDRARPIYVDCLTGSLSAWHCQSALMALHGIGFGRLIAVEMSRSWTSAYCKE